MADTAPDDAHLAPVSSLRSRFEQPTQQTHKARASESMSLGHGRVPIAAATAVGRRVASASHAVTEDPEERPPSTRSAFVSRPAPPPPPPTAPRPQILSAPASVNDLSLGRSADERICIARHVWQCVWQHTHPQQVTVATAPIIDILVLIVADHAGTTTDTKSFNDGQPAHRPHPAHHCPRQLAGSHCVLILEHWDCGSHASGLKLATTAANSTQYWGVLVWCFGEWPTIAVETTGQWQLGLGVAVRRHAIATTAAAALAQVSHRRTTAAASVASTSLANDTDLGRSASDAACTVGHSKAASTAYQNSGRSSSTYPASSTSVATTRQQQLVGVLGNQSATAPDTFHGTRRVAATAAEAQFDQLGQRRVQLGRGRGRPGGHHRGPARGIPDSRTESHACAYQKTNAVRDDARLVDRIATTANAVRLPDWIRVPTSNGQAVVAVCGRLVVFGIGFGLVIWDTVAGVEQFNLDSKHLGLKDKDRVTAAAFRPALDEEPGRYVWVGTKEGHLLELDAWTGRVVDVRAAIHSGAVLRMVRGGAELVTVDDAGKALRWVCARGTNGASMLRQAARLVRLAERGVPTWVGLWGGWLWVASSGAAAPHPKSSTKSGLGKLKDLASGASSSTPSLRQWRDIGRRRAVPGVGAVHCGSMLMSTPGLVYLGHEGGVVSVWSFAADNGVDELLISPLQSALSNSSTYSLPSLHSTSSSDSTSSLTSPPPSNLKRRTPPSLEYSVKVGSSDVFTLDGIAARLWVGSRKGTITAYDPSDGAHRPWRATNIWQATGTGSESSDDTAIAVGKEGLPVVHVGLDLQPGATRLAVHSVGRDSVLRFWDGLLGANARNTALDGREEAFCEYRQADTLFDHTNGGNVAGNRRFLDDLVRDAQAPEIVVFGFQEVVDLDDRAVTAKTVLLGKNKPKSNGAAANGNTVLTEVESHITPRYRAWQDAMARALARALPGTPYAVVAVQQLVGLFSVAFVRRDQMGEGMGLRDVAVGVVKRGLGGRWGNKGAVAVRFVLDDSSICLVNCHLAAGQKHIQQRNADIAAILEDRAALPVSGGDGYDQDGDLRSPGGGAVAYRRWEVDVSDHRPVSAVFALRVRRVDWQRREREVRKAAVEQHTREQEMMEAVWRWEGACGRV
ncbi:hypothetical protein BKA62DRAFT_677314 [Auriculariales sp. MPI-PUGE-AT-0066]|nr:hypothetical protein BKA62DRAFT_677314 [Auriculariales sp. MPI-PUGE-AT-0066]